MKKHLKLLQAYKITWRDAMTDTSVWSNLDTAAEFKEAEKAAVMVSYGVLIHEGKEQYFFVQTWNAPLKKYLSCLAISKGMIMRVEEI